MSEIGKKVRDAAWHVLKKPLTCWRWVNLLTGFACLLGVAKNCLIPATCVIGGRHGCNSINICTMMNTY
jgi:hypothetical protein